MPRPRNLVRNHPIASKTFVNRSEPLRLLFEGVEGLRSDTGELLVFYGLGGQGKTTLCNEFLRRLKDRQQEVNGLNIAHIDLRGRKELPPMLSPLVAKCASCQ
jgi:Cdc6-like AAA superfamily ATPase